MKTILYLLIITLLAGCAGKGQVVKKEKGAAPDFDAMIARESKGLTLKKTDGALGISLFSASPAKTKLTNKAKPVQYEVNIPIGASIDADCYLTEEAAFPSVVLKSIFDNIGSLDTIEQHRIKEIKSGVLHNIPYLYIEAEYVTKEKHYGIAKMIASSTMDVSFYCSHDELGYKETFFDTIKSLAKSSYMQGFVEELSNYRQKQIDIIYLNKMSVGYSESYRMDIEGNNKRDMTFSSILIPRSADAVFTNDSVDYTTYNGKSGHLLEGEYYSYTNDEADHELTLMKGKKRNYSVKGLFQGKEINESFKSKKDLLYSGHIIDLYIQNKTKKRKWEFTEYVPLSPAGPTTSIIKLLKKKGKDSKTIEYSFAGAKATVELDKQSYSRMDMNLGNASFKMVREYLDIK
ncbi:MAG: hypothetical protein OEV42_04095 [Deltaproteobacteria bacterium]|nr:hypothetical protein [Deltaproteobacteria bacterium]